MTTNQNETERLRAALKDLMAIVAIHSKQTGRDFAWAEMDHAQSVLNETQEKR